MKIRRKDPLRAALLLSAISFAVMPTLVAYQSEALAQGAPKLEDSVIFAMPGGPAQDQLKACVDKSFTKETNVHIDFQSIQTPQALAKIVAQRSAPQIDVMWSTDAQEYTGFKQDLFLPLTSSLVPNLANLDPKYSPVPNKGAMISISIQGIQYNTKVFKDKGWAPPTSWHDLWIRKYKGHVGIYDLGAGAGQALLAVAAYLNGGDSKNVDAAFANLVKLKPNLYTIFDQAPQYDTAMLNGQAWLGITNAGRPLALLQQGSPISFVQPKEGVVISKLLLDVVKNGPHPNATVAFANWMLSKEGQSCLPNGYPPVIKGVSTPADMAPFLSVQVPIIPLDAAGMQEKLPDLVKRWNEQMNG